MENRQNGYLMIFSRSSRAYISLGAILKNFHGLEKNTFGEHVGILTKFQFVYFLQNEFKDQNDLGFHQ